MEKAICLDLDGVLAYGSGREWDEYDKVKYDVSDDFMADLVSRFGEYQILIVTARDESARLVTEDWLAGHGIHYNQLWMRQKSDKYQMDEEAKEEIYNKHIKGRYAVQAVFEDSCMCCIMWKRLGLKVLQII
jgi:uncharacterized HAD superfamily protein